MASRVASGCVVALGALVPLLSASPAAAQGTDVSIVGQAYVPVIISIVVGDSVTWTNNDAETHSVNLGDVFGDNLVAPGATYTATFSTAGEFVYFCTLHGHAGKVVVTATADTTAPPPPTTPKPTVPPTTKPKPPTTVARPTTALTTVPAPPPTSASVVTTAATVAPAPTTPSATTEPSTSSSVDESLPPPIKITSSSGSAPGIPTGLLAGGAVAGAGAGVGGGVVMRRRAARTRAPRS